jgi:hypothetical protein
METDDPAAAVESLRTLVETGKMAMSEAFSMEDMAIHLYETITPLVCKAPEGA